MPGVTFCKRPTDYFVVLFTHKNKYLHKLKRRSGSSTEQVGAGRVDGWGGGQALGTGACAVLRGSLGCPGPDQRPGDWSDGRQRWCGWVGCWRPLERGKTTPNYEGLEVSTGWGTLPFGALAPRPTAWAWVPGRVGHRAGAPSWPSRGWSAIVPGGR